MADAQIGGPALVWTGGAWRELRAKTAHGVVRASERFEVVGVVDGPALAGRDAGELLDGRRRDIPIFESLAAALAGARRPPRWMLVGIATHGGALTADVEEALAAALDAGLSVVNGLHGHAAPVPRLAALAAERGARIVDLRRAKPFHQLRFWDGSVRSVRAPRVAVLGTDCAIGKRTTARLLVAACRAHALATEMVYTGQTGWMEGGDFGLLLDATPNDFVSGELEGAVVACDRERAPDLIVIEGQGALRSPSGPCGSEMILSAGARGVVLQHAPGRPAFQGHGAAFPIPSVAEEIELLRLLGARTLAVTLNAEGLSPGAFDGVKRELARDLGLPVLDPLGAERDALVEAVRAFIDAERAGGTA